LTAVVLDSSAVLAAILNERGGGGVFDRIEEAAISSVNVAEVYSFAAINTAPLEAIDAFFADTGIEVAPFSHGHAVVAGRFASLTRKAGLSLGDRACLALAADRGAESADGRPGLGALRRRPGVDDHPVALRPLGAGEDQRPGGRALVISA
jgi:PIN domain nuclease of toxin-antitoxin system